VELSGVLADDSAGAGRRVAVHAEAAGRGLHPVAVGQVSDQVDGLVFGQSLDCSCSLSDKTEKQESEEPLDRIGTALQALHRDLHDVQDAIDEIVSFAEGEAEGGSHRLGRGGNRLAIEIWRRYPIKVQELL
jgi:hypothetical protein